MFSFLTRQILEIIVHFLYLLISFVLLLEMTSVIQKYTNMIQSIRETDTVTPIILEPTFWGRVHALNKFPIGEILKLDSNLVFSVHFYEPMTLTSRIRNKGRYAFPCAVPWYDDVEFSEDTFWDESSITALIHKAKTWAVTNGVRMFLGEFGITRDIEGAESYLKAVMKACKITGMTGFAFSFRDPDWEAMDYEFGEDLKNCSRRSENNSLMRAIVEGISSMNM